MSAPNTPERTAEESRSPSRSNLATSVRLYGSPAPEEAMTV